MQIERRYKRMRGKLLANRAPGNSMVNCSEDDNFEANICGGNYLKSRNLVETRRQMLFFQAYLSTSLDLGEFLKILHAAICGLLSDSSNVEEYLFARFFSLIL